MSVNNTENDDHLQVLGNSLSVLFGIVIFLFCALMSVVYPQIYLRTMDEDRTFKADLDNDYLQQLKARNIKMIVVYQSKYIYSSSIDTSNFYCLTFPKSKCEMLDNEYNVDSGLRFYMTVDDKGIHYFGNPDKTKTYEDEYNKIYSRLNIIMSHYDVKKLVDDSWKRPV